MLGVLGNVAVNPGGANGLLYGGTDFFVKQLVGVLLSSIYAFVFTYGMLWIISRFARVKTTQDEETTLDESLHGEIAYVS
jgi:Amt family ammonium transporter